MYTKLYVSIFYFLVVFFLLVTSVQAQTSMNKNGLTYKFLITDYNTLDIVYQNSNDPDRILHPDAINYAGEIGYYRHIIKSLNIGAAFRLGSIDVHHLTYDSTLSNCQPCEIRKVNEFFFSTDIQAVYKFNNGYILKEDFILAPYIFTGMSFLYLSQRTGNFDFQIPVGLGLNIKLTKMLYLQGQFEYRKSLVVKKDNLAISFGILWLIN